MMNPVRAKLITGIRLLCVFLFVYTASAKIMDHERFLNGLAKVAILSGFAALLSWAVPILEIIIAALLIIPRFIKQGFYAFTGLMTLFSGYILSMLLWARHLPCRCGGAIEKLSWPEHLWFNGAFIALAIVAIQLIHSPNIKK
ncbi:MAG: MauE/DoxX family redox-associated membrane protein [Sphingobacteriales bacterium]